MLVDSKVQQHQLFTAELVYYDIIITPKVLPIYMLKYT